MATNFQAPITQGGPDTGISTTDTTVGVPFIKTVVVSAAGRSVTTTLPDSAYIHSATGFVTVACSSAGQGIRIRVGDSTSDTKYGVAGAVATTGQYILTMTGECASAKTLLISVTASVAASAAQWTEGKVKVNIVGGFNL